MNPTQGSQDSPPAPPPASPVISSGSGTPNGGQAYYAKQPSFFDRFFNNLKGNAKFMAFAGVVLLIIAMPVTLTLVRSEQDIRQEAAKNKNNNKNNNNKNNNKSNNKNNNNNNNKNSNKNNNKNNKNNNKGNNKNKGNNNGGGGGGSNFKISCQPAQTVNIAGSRKIRAVVRDKNNKLVNGRTVVWSITNNPGNWITKVTKSSKTQKGIATATIQPNPNAISNAGGTITAKVNGDTALCRISLKNAQKPVINNDPGGDNDNPGGDNDNPGGDNDNPGGDHDNPSGDHDNPGGDDDLQGDSVLTTLNLQLFLHGIGKGGDQANPNAQGNPTPQTPDRIVQVELYDVNNQLTSELVGTVTYDSASGSYKGTIEDILPEGEYTVIVDTDNYLRQALPGILRVRK